MTLSFQGFERDREERRDEPFERGTCLVKNESLYTPAAIFIFAISISSASSVLSVAMDNGNGRDTD